MVQKYSSGKNSHFDFPKHGQDSQNASNMPPLVHVIRVMYCNSTKLKSIWLIKAFRICLKNSSMYIDILYVSCVPTAASFSGLSIPDCSFRFSLTFIYNNYHWKFVNHFLLFCVCVEKGKAGSACTKCKHPLDLHLHCLMCLTRRMYIVFDYLHLRLCK